MTMPQPYLVLRRKKSCYMHGQSVAFLLLIWLHLTPDLRVWSVNAPLSCFAYLKGFVFQALILQVLDATFDDVLVLALPRMPDFLSGIGNIIHDACKKDPIDSSLFHPVRSTIRNHVNLHVSKELRGYNGPIRIIRRTDDEIIADPPGVLANNRGNYLLVDIIRQRYPDLLEPRNSIQEKTLMDWLAKTHLIDPNISAAHNSEPKIPNEVNSLTAEAKSRLVVQIVRLNLPPCH